MRFDIRAVVAATACMFATGCSHGNPFAEKSPSPAPTPVDVPTAQVNRLADDLVSGTPVRVRRAIEMPPGQRLDPAFVRQLRGLTVDFDTSSAVAVGENQVRLDATVTTADGSAEKWQVTLDRVGGRYLIADTVRPS